MAANATIAKGAVVCKEAILKGDVTIGTGTVVHPKALIHAEAGPIVIGNNNIIEEQVVIHNRPQPVAEGETAPKDKLTMEIGSSNVFEVGCRCESLHIGDNNTLESKCHIGVKSAMTSGCVLGACCHLTSQETLPENTVVFGEGNLRRVQGDKPTAPTLQLDFLTKILPNYHHLQTSQSAAPAAAAAGTS
ncbi:dynactin subunit 6-like [Sycon ciliatum]|uniref:dynactin subunit 6-like n=1 Tax=Sycon ciliatum TaxID=27933 RepID=UPI0031F671C7